VNEELIPLNLLIADRTFRIRILPKDEEVVRRTAKTINDKLFGIQNCFCRKGHAGLYFHGIDLVWPRHKMHLSPTKSTWTMLAAGFKRWKRPLILPWKKTSMRGGRSSKHPIRT
jgi:hypothetical protein